MNREVERQVMHFLVGLLTIGLLYYFGKSLMVGIVFFVVITGLLIINRRILGMKVMIVDLFVQRFEREDVLFPGFGSACYATGVLIPLVFLTDINQIAAAIFILAFGDGISTVIGRLGKARLPYNPEKSIEGSVAFFLASLPAYLFIGPAIVPLAAVASLVESIPFGLDDNLTIPIACTVFFLVL